MAPIATECVSANIEKVISACSYVMCLEGLEERRNLFLPNTEGDVELNFKATPTNQCAISQASVVNDEILKSFISRRHTGQDNHVNYRTC